MVWLDLRIADILQRQVECLCERYGIRTDGQRLVFRHQICQEAVLRLDSAMSDVLVRRSAVEEGTVEGQNLKS
jgi:hypothetical protein